MRTPSEVRAANRLWSLRQRAGLSREAFAARLAVDPEEPLHRSARWVEKIEKGHSPFPFDQSDILARALGVPISDVLWNRIPSPTPGRGVRPGST